MKVEVKHKKKPRIKSSVVFAGRQVRRYMTHNESFMCVEASKQVIESDGDIFLHEIFHLSQNKIVLFDCRTLTSPLYPQLHQSSYFTPPDPKSATALQKKSREEYTFPIFLGYHSIKFLAVVFA